MLSIVSNASSLNAQKNLSRTQSNLNTSLARLSSGLRINRAGDDAAGLAISENLKAQIRSFKQAERNANDGVSLLQVAEGGMNEVSGILSRMRELAMQSANGTYGTTEQGYLDQEYQDLIAEVDRIAAVTEFNGTALLDGTATIDLQVGIRNTNNDRISVSIADMASGSLATFGDITSSANAQAELDEIDAAIDSVNAARATIGAAQNRLMVTVTNLQNAHENSTEANSRIRETDVADESAAMTRAQILMQAGVSVLAQANQLPSMALSLLGR